VTTISKFYLRDAATPNTGTMPSNSPAVIGGGVLGTGTEASGASTARDATDVHGSPNPDLESVVTAQAASTHQRLGHRRFVSRPLAATTFTSSDGNWTLSEAAFCSNTNHITFGNDGPKMIVYLWRPSTGLQVGTATVALEPITPLTTSEAVRTDTGSWSGTQAILDGDIIVFDVYSDFTQTMATAYTDSFSYDGTTDASITTCASFVTPPVALTLFTASTFTASPIRVADQAVNRSSVY
jgi:hypothetical protein